MPSITEASVRIGKPFLPALTVAAACALNSSHVLAGPLKPTDLSMSALYHIISMDDVKGAERIWFLKSG